MRTLCLTLATAGCLAAQPYQYFVTGNEADVKTSPRPGVLLSGGGKDIDAAFEWFLGKAAGGDVVVLRASGADGYHDYFVKLARIDSVETIVFRSAEASRDPFVIERIRNAEAIFLAGGDQWNYVRFWKDTPVEEAIHDAVRRGAPIGGTSAGLAILGQFAFSAEHDTVTSAEALADPFSPKVAISSDFLSLPQMRCLITDTHFSRRDRMGRLLVFLARIRKESGCGAVRGLGIDERTAVLLEIDNHARVVGAGSAYLLLLKNRAGILKPHAPADIQGIQVISVPAGQRFDFKRWRAQKTVRYKLRVESGEIRSNKPAGTY
jgi:cyanophycinase